MTSEVQNSLHEQSSKLQNIFKIKHPLKKLSYNASSNNRLNKKLPLTL